MLKKMIGLVAVLSVLLARDNPFEPEINSKNLQGGFSGIYDDYLKEIHVDLPTSARILKKSRSLTRILMALSILKSWVLIKALIGTTP